MVSLEDDSLVGLSPAKIEIYEFITLSNHLQEDWLRKLNYLRNLT